MGLNLKRLSLANARLETLTRIETDLRAQFLELTELRERFERGAAFGGSTKRDTGSKARASCYRRSRLACVIGLAIPGKAVSHHHYPLRSTIPIADKYCARRKLVSSLLIKADETRGHRHAGVLCVRPIKNLPGLLIQVAKEIG